MSDFRRYLIQRETYIEKVGMATAEIRRSLDPSVRRRYADKKYISAPDVLWQDIARECNRVAKIDANVGLYKLNAIRRVDFDSATAYHARILEIAMELRNTGTELPESVLAFYMVQGLPTGDVWLAFRTSLTASKSASKCQDILDQLQIFERSYAWDRHGVSAYTNTESSTALFAKKGTGGSKKKDGKATDNQAPRAATHLTTNKRVKSPSRRSSPRPSPLLPATLLLPLPKSLNPLDRNPLCRISAKPSSAPIGPERKGQICIVFL
jgi:hypothetical protein